MHFIASLEMLLLLLWRHIAYYCDSLHVNNPNMKVSTAAVLRSVPQPNDGAAFREDAAKRLSHVLNQLVQLNLVSHQLARIGCHITTEQDYKWRESHAYIETISRRIRDLVGLRVESGEVNGTTV
jgi:nuclear pore complex protein Nup205